jgi:cytochrome c biogenesis protein CcmG, thiol:disulfide interchange protein DsbE
MSKPSAIQAMANRSFAIILIAGCALASCGHANGSSSVAASQPAHVGRPAPNWSETSIPGPSLSLASLHGEAVYLNFFATWCPPCAQEAPSIDALAREYRAAGLRVVGVDVLENAKKAALFRAEHHLSYPVIVDTGTLRDQYDVNGLPVHVFIDRQGTVRNIVVGELSAAEMRADVERLLR